jgi:addiction module RelE/StbE family toxin
MNIRWSNVAQADLDNIYAYIARDVPYYAAMFIDRLIHATDRLVDNPHVGRKVPECGYREDIRELILQRYRIIYLISDDTIQILTIIHGSRDFENLSLKL